MSKILKKWAGGEELAKTAVLNIATPWYDCECAHCFSRRAEELTIARRLVHTGEKMGAAQWRPAVMAETGGDFLLMKVRATPISVSVLEANTMISTKTSTDSSTASLSSLAQRSTSACP